MSQKKATLGARAFETQSLCVCFMFAVVTLSLQLETPTIVLTAEPVPGPSADDWGINSLTGFDFTVSCSVTHQLQVLPGFPFQE